MNSDKQQIDYSILLKYFEDRASEEETKLINGWLEGNEKSYKCENCMHLLWNELDPEAIEKDVDLEALLDRIHHSIHLKSGKGSNARILRKDRNTGMSLNHILRNLGRIAAIFLLPVMVYIGWEICSQKMWVNNQAEVVFNEINCPLGATSKFELPDGTRGMLNNGSTLSYPVKFSGNTREVMLYGEACFDIQESRSRPFIIKTVGLDVKVLGTKVNVYSYPDENYQEFTLISGSAELIHQDENEVVTITEMKPGHHVLYRYGDGGVETRTECQEKDLVIIEDKEQFENLASRLEPGKSVLYKSEKGDIYVKKGETDRYTGWTDGKLILRNDPMPVLLKRVERWYSVKFNINDKRINEYTYWATFMDESLDEVLRNLSLTGPIMFNKFPRVKAADGTLKTQEIDITIKESP